MSSIRLDLEVTTVEPAGDLTFVEGRAPDGTQLAVYLSAAALRGSSLAAGQRLQVALDLPTATTAATAPPLRERMSRPASAGAAAPTTARAAAQATPRAATTAAPPARAAEAASAGPTTARPGAAAPTRGTEAGAGTPTRTETSATLLSFVLGTPGAEAGIDRDIEDEMDALLGRKKRGPGN